MALAVHLNFNGNCREAVDFYKDVFEIKDVQISTYGDAPPMEGFPPLPEEMKNLIMHTELDICGDKIFLADCLPFNPSTPGTNVIITLISKDKEQLTKWFSRLKDGAKVHCELAETFFSPYYGMLYDKFGVSWELMIF